MPLQVASMCFIDKFSGASPRTYWGLRTPPDPQLTIADTKVSVQHMTRKMSQTNVLPWGGGGVDGFPHSAHGGEGQVQ